MTNILHAFYRIDFMHEDGNHAWNTCMFAFRIDVMHKTINLACNTWKLFHVRKQKACTNTCMIFIAYICTFPQIIYNLPYLCMNFSNRVSPFCLPHPLTGIAHALTSWVTVANAHCHTMYTLNPSTMLICGCSDGAGCPDANRPPLQIGVLWDFHFIR